MSSEPVKWYDGMIKHVQVYARVLSAREIRQLYPRKHQWILWGLYLLITGVLLWALALSISDLVTAIVELKETI